MEATVAGEILGAIQRRNGTRKREVCSADIRSPDITKITSIHATTGIQYFTNECMFEVGKNWSGGCANYRNQGTGAWHKHLYNNEKSMKFQIGAATVARTPP
jgi:hypothetical protein